MSVLGFSGSEFFVFLIVVAIVVGPQNLPEYTRKLTQLIRELRVMLDNARTQIAQEVGPEFEDLNLSDLDPRQYDPRKIVRDALGEDIDAIRKDLSNPLGSFTEAVKQSSQEMDKAADTLNSEARSSRKHKTIAKTVQRRKPNENATETKALPASEQQTADVAAQATDPVSQPSAEVVEATAQTSTEQAPKAIPASVQASTKSTRPAIKGTRPVSPRDIVRAANEAARTRAEAAHTTVDA